MTTYYYGKETAKIIRQELKQEFPHTKFSVRSDHDSVKITWLDGASFKAVNDFASQFQGKHFNGMIDIAENTNTTWNDQEVCFNTYISCSRDLSPEFAQKILVYCVDKYSNHNYLDITSVTIDTNTYEGKTYASFNGSACQETACISDGSITHIRRTHRAIAADTTLDWAKDSAILKAKEQAEIADIEQKNAARQAFINEQVCDLPDLEAGGIIIDDVAYRLIGTEPVVGGEGSNDEPFCLHYWRYKFEGADKRRISLDLETVDNYINPIVPFEITPCDIRIKAKFASLNKNDSIRDYHSLCNKPKTYFQNNEKYSHWCIEQCRVIEKISLAQEDYDRFAESLLTSREWLKGKGGGNSDAEGLPNKPFYQLGEADRKSWQAQSYLICLAVIAEDRETILINPEGSSYARYVGLVSQSINDELEQFKAAHQSIVKLQDDKENKADKFTLDSLYKVWVQELIASDRLSEIIAYQAWRNTYGQTMLEKQYSTFVKQCLKDEIYLDITSFDDWIATAFQEQITISSNF